jgi:hypothetical protein
MKSMTLPLFVFAAATAAFGGGLPVTQLRGEYVEARNADVYVGACFANSEVNQVGDLAVFGWRVSKGSWEGVNLDGLSVVGVVRASGTIGDVHRSSYPAKAILIVDEKANAEQRLALQQFAKQMGGDLLQDVVKVVAQPISLSVEDGNVHAAKATLVAGELAKIQTRAIEEGDKVCSHEGVWYTPLSKLDHSMPAYALANEFRGKGLDVTWSSPEKRSAFVGNFQYQR